MARHSPMQKPDVLSTLTVAPDLCHLMHIVESEVPNWISRGMGAVKCRKRKSPADQGLRDFCKSYGDRDILLNALLHPKTNKDYKTTNSQKAL